VGQKQLLHRVPDISKCCDRGVNLWQDISHRLLEHLWRSKKRDRHVGTRYTLVSLRLHYRNLFRLLEGDLE